MGIPPGLVNSKLSHPIFREENSIEVTMLVTLKWLNEFLWVHKSRNLEW